MHAPDGPLSALRVTPGSFEPEKHFYTRVLNAQIHPLVHFLLSLTNERIIERYCYLNPAVDRAALSDQLTYKPRHLQWAGCDLMHVTTPRAERQMVVIETNSCPSGQKSMPLFEELQEQGGYRAMIRHAFATLVNSRRLPEGELAVIYDKNEMEATGYAAAMADEFDAPVYLARFDQDDPDPPVRFVDGVLEVRDEKGDWIAIRAALRYVTQRPWNRIPVHTKTAVLNPTVVCLAGGRNKMVAAIAYEFFNNSHAGDGFAINTPQTIRDVAKNEIPFWIESLGGKAVIKVPYSNAGQGVYTITSPAELDAFMAETHHYEQFIVQSLIGHPRWSSTSRRGRLFHIGTMPDRLLRIFVADLRVMVCAGPEGFLPLAIYARRARDPLGPSLTGVSRSWDMLGTNLSVKNADGTWDTESSRLLLMDRKDFNRLGLGLDDLIEAYIQTVLATVAIDQMAQRLYNTKGRFRMRLFKSINDDPALIDEIAI